MEFREHTLDNGLEVVAEVNAEARSQALGFFVKTGARDEVANIAGVSHFLEHMAFKGTPTRSAEDVNRQFDAIGSHANAYTSEEQTVYYAAVLPEYQEAALELLADILRPALRQEDFDTEKQVILEEIRMYEDQPPFCADDKARALHFGRHVLSNSVLGSAESITALSVDSMRDYFRARYSPANVALVAAGQVDFDKLVADAGRLCGHWEPAAASRCIEPAKTNNSFQCLHKPEATQEYAILLSDGPSATDFDRYAAKVLTTIIGDDSGSRFYWELVDPGLAEHVSIGHHDYLGAGLFFTYMSCAPKFTVDNLAAIQRIFREVQADGITQTELEQAKNKINARVVLGSERPRGRLFNLGINWTYRREYRSVKDDLDAVDRLSRDDLLAVLAKYPLTRTTLLVIGPLDDLKQPA